MAALRIKSERHGDEYVVELAGELDLGGESELVAELDRALQSDAAAIVIDLRGLEFIDSTGIKVLVQTANRSRNSGRLRILRGPDAVQRVFQVAEVEDELPFADE